MVALADGEERRSFHLGWSLWRRTQQAVAARCHSARRARGRDRPAASPAGVPAPSPAVASSVGELTAADWDAVRPLLPPQRPPAGRPRHDHRTVLGGIVWVIRNQASWRALPPVYGKWETAYKRYRLWQATGLWQQLATVLGLESSENTAEVSL